VLTGGVQLILLVWAASVAGLLERVRLDGRH
jgi:hypothetical protein